MAVVDLRFALRLVILRFVRPPEPSAEAEIGQLNVTLGVDQNVVRLDVAMDEAQLVDAFNGADQFGSVKPVRKKKFASN